MDGPTSSIKDIPDTARHNTTTLMLLLKRPSGPRTLLKLDVEKTDQP
jgi:hypothetical protein